MSLRYTKLPPLSGLMTFHAVAKAQSFSHAAKQLHVTQGAVSHRVRGLEDALGFSLFLRLPRHVELTPSGQVLFAAVDEAFGRLQAGMVELDRLVSDNRVAVSCSPSFAIRWLVPRLGQLRADVPEIEVHVAADDRLVEPGVGVVDVCVRFGPGGYQRVHAVRLTHEDVRPVCSPLYREQNRIERPEDLARCVLLHADALSHHTAHIGWQEWSAAASQTGLDPLSGVHFSHAHMALEAATAGQGLALGRSTLTADAIASGRLVRPFEHTLRCGFAYWLLMPRRSELRPAVEQFRDWLLEELKVDAAARGQAQ